MARRNSLIFLTAFGLLLTGCGKFGLEITKEDILEVARDDANVTKVNVKMYQLKNKKVLILFHLLQMVDLMNIRLVKMVLFQNVTSSIVLKKKKVFKKNLLKKRYQQQLRKRKFFYFI